MNEEQFEQIERYAAGQMSEDEARAMQERLATDQALQAAYAQYEQARQLVEQAAFNEQKARIRQLDQQASQPVWLRYGGVAAAAALLIAAFYVFRPQPSAPELALQYFETYPDRITTMGDQTSAQAAMNAYNAGDFKKAVELFSALSEAEQTGMTQLYLGVSWLAQDSCAQARAVLQPLSTQEANTQEVAQWYLVLAQLQCKQIDLARATLEAYLADENHRFNRTKAQELFEALND